MSHKQAVNPTQAQVEQVPPLLESSALLGHLHSMRDGWPQLFMRAMHEKGDIVRLRFAMKHVYFLFHPSYVAQVLTRHSDRYARQTRGYKKLGLLLGQGLVTSEGDFWKRQRRIAQPAFHKERIAGFVETFAKATEAMSTRWEDVAQKEQRIDGADAMMALTLQIAGETLFSSDISQSTSAFGTSLSYALKHFSRLVSAPVPYPEYMPTLRNWRFWKSIRTMDRIVWDLINERRKSGEDKGDLLSMLMLTRNEETGETMSDKQLRDEAFTMLSAGHETTANALAWTLYLLTQHPDVADRVAEENQALLGDRLPTPEDLKKLTYTEQVFRESMRLYPPVWAIARKSMQDDEFDGYKIPAGHFVFMSQYAVHRHPVLWEEPEAFRPERFAPEKVEARKQIKDWRYLYFPFSRGQRQCIGDQFAMMEGLTILSILSRRFRFRLAQDAKIELEASITLRPKHGVPMYIERR